MNETKWLAGTDGDVMLDFVADRLSPRQWMLLAAAFTRRLWDLLPVGVLQDAVEAIERAEKPLATTARTAWIRKINEALPAAVAATEQAQREIVKFADPDAADQTDPVLARPNQVVPAFPLFAAASRHARNSVNGISEALEQAAEALRGLFAVPNEQMLGQVSECVGDAVASRQQANRSANMALRLKGEGDELADRAAGAKNKHLERARAEETVRKIEEAGAVQSDDLGRVRGDRKHLARFLREIVGNAFTPPDFDPAWRTADAVGVARSIFEARTFDRMPILADALLEADCDSESILRHCRGTEQGVKEQPVHVRGCWVIELILDRWKPLPPLDPNAKPRLRRTRFEDLDIGLPFDLGDRG